MNRAYDDPKAWGMETPEQLAVFEELVGMANEYRQKQHNRAQAVFDIFCEEEIARSFEPETPLEVNEVKREHKGWRLRMNEAIHENLDHRSIEFFMALVSKQRIKLDRTMQARKQHGRTHEIRRFVKVEWKKHKEAYEGNKSAFARDYVRRVKNEFEMTITEKQMREVWLKDTPSASKPAG